MVNRGCFIHTGGLLPRTWIDVMHSTRPGQRPDSGKDEEVRMLHDQAGF